MMQHIRLLLVTISAFILFVACDKKLDELTPHNSNFEEQQFSTKGGYLRATVGNYATMATTTEMSQSTNMDYLWLNLSEFRGNNVTLVDRANTNELLNAKERDAFTYSNSALKDYAASHYYWRAAYKTLLGVNLVLKHVKANETDVDLLNVKGENLFLRSVLFFDLVRLFGRPYYQSPETNPGVPLILEPIVRISDRPSRATVRATYDQVIKDLLASADLMTKKTGNTYANKYAAYALLSRVYLYMGGTMASPNNEFNQKAIQYADSVILNGGYTLLQATAYQNYYTTNNPGNTETIWALSHSGGGTQNVTPFVFQGTTSGSASGSWARPSADFLNLLAPNDLRWAYYKVKKYPNNNVDTFQVEKYGYQFIGSVSQAPLHYLRLAEIYLNRAEARVKAGDNNGALDDLNVIRTRAGLGAAVALTGLALFDEILKQRRIELAFEGHNSFDYFRNGLPMVRNYNSYESPAITVAATDKKVVLPISQDEINYNPQLVQNDQ